MSVQHHTADFFEFIRAIGAAKSKQEEDKIVSAQITNLKALLFASKKVTPQLVKEYVVRGLYCEMLGHNAEFSYIHAVKLTSSVNVLHKRVGFLGINLCIPKSHELILLLTATIQRNLISTNYLEVCAALNIVTKVATKETVPAFLERVLKLKPHTQPLVRKKVIMALLSFHALLPGCTDIITHCKEFLCDRDPSVMGSSLNAFLYLAKDSTSRIKLKKIIGTFVDVLNQVIEHRLSDEYNYNRIPAPWMQIKLLKLMGYLGKDDKIVSGKIYKILADVMKKSNTGYSIGSAIVYEAINTITQIYPSRNLLETAANAISRFITSSNKDLQYLGIQSLRNMVKINPKYAAQHQKMVIQSLEDEDDSIKRVTLDLLYSMTTSKNCTVIVKKLINVAKKSVVDTHLKSELIGKIAYLGENYAPNPYWYIDTMNVLFKIGAEFVPLEDVQTMINIIAEGIDEEEASDSSNSDEDEDQKNQKLRVYCVNTYVEMVSAEDVIHDKLLQVIIWVIGEYGFLTKKYTVDELIETLCELSERRFEKEETTAYLVNSILKLSSSLPSKVFPNSTSLEFLDGLLGSRNIDIQQRAYEAKSLLNKKSLLTKVIPEQGSSQDIEIDEDLSFLDDFVDDCRENGYKDYLKEENRYQIDSIISKKEKVLRTDKYKAPEVKKSSIHNSFYDPGLKNFDMGKSGFYDKSYKSETGMDMGSVKQVWTWDDEEEENDDDEENHQEKKSKNDSNGSDESENDDDVSQLKNWVKEKNLTKTSPEDDDDDDDELMNYKNAYKPEEKKLSKKGKKLAEDIFGGGSSRTKKSKKPKKPKKPKKSKKLKKPKKPKVIQKEESEKSEESEEEPKKNESQKKSVEKKGNPLVDNLDDFFIIPPTNTVDGSKDDSNDPFDFVLKPTKLEDIPKPKKEIQEKIIDDSILCQDKYIIVTHEKEEEEDHLLYTLTLSTERGYTLKGIQCQFQPPEGYTIVFQSQVKPTILKKNSISFSKLEPGFPIMLRLRFDVKNVTFGTQLMGSITYTNIKKAREFLRFNEKLELQDILRPAVMKTKFYSKKWGSHRHEKRLQLKGQYTLDQIRNGLRNQLKVHIVQTIGSEVIAAVKLMGIEKLCLIHVKKLKNYLSFTVRTENSLLSDKVILLAKTLKN